MEEQPPPDRLTANQPPYSDRMILLAGIVLIVCAFVAWGIFPLTLTNSAIIIALIGIGCASIWFGLIHPAVRTGGKRIKQINRKADDVRERVYGKK